jgi:hypothetical protein
MPVIAKSKRFMSRPKCFNGNSKSISLGSMPVSARPKSVIGKSESFDQNSMPVSAAVNHFRLNSMSFLVRSKGFSGNSKSLAAGQDLVVGWVWIGVCRLYPASASVAETHSPTDSGRPTDCLNLKNQSGASLNLLETQIIRTGHQKGSNLKVMQTLLAAALP